MRHLWQLGVHVLLCPDMPVHILRRAPAGIFAGPGLQSGSPKLAHQLLLGRQTPMLLQRRGTGLRQSLGAIRGSSDTLLRTCNAPRGDAGMALSSLCLPNLPLKMSQPSDSFYLCSFWERVPLSPRRLALLPILHTHLRLLLQLAHLISLR